MQLMTRLPRATFSFLKLWARLLILEVATMVELMLQETIIVSTWQYSIVLL